MVIASRLACALVADRLPLTNSGRHSVNLAAESEFHALRLEPAPAIDRLVAGSG